MRLIDADALLAAYDTSHKGPPGAARKLIEDAPTVKLWHVFYETKDGKMSVECIPNNGERFLLYRKRSKWFNIEEWDDDYWAEYACTGDRYDIEEGDAWMELYEPQEVGK